MKIQYNSTIDEAIEEQWRLLKLSRTARKMKWERLWAVPIVFFVLYLVIPDEISVKLIFAATFSVIFAVLDLSTYKKNVRRRIRKLIIENLGTDKPVPSEYEFDERGLIFRRLGTEIKFQWSTVTKINEDNKDIEFIIGNRNIAIIPKRIFDNEQQKNEWLTYAKEKTNIS